MKLSAQSAVASGGLVLAVSVLLPILKSISGPALTGARVGTGALLQGVANTASYLKEEVEDFVAETQFERLKKRIDSDIT